MAQHAEPMDVDCMDSDFDKENTFHHGNVPCTEKGYEELDVSELNMKLRYSVTPASSPMSKSFTACSDNRYLETEDVLNCNNTNTNLTRSLNSTMTKNDSIIKSLKSLPLQSLHTEQFTDGNGNTPVLRQLDSNFTDDANVTITITGAIDIDENVSLPSSSSSELHTPEATTPTKEIKDGGSPIMRGLKSVLNIFRSSQSPVPPQEGDSIIKKQEMNSADALACDNTKAHAVASTPIATHRTREGNSSKRSSPHKDSIVFNDDLEKELNWKNDTTFNSSIEKIPIHKMLLQNAKSQEGSNKSDLNNTNVENNFNATVEYMDVSNNDTVIEDKTMTEYHDVKDVSVAPESDSEFLDCETTFSKNESYVLDIKTVQQKLAVNETLSKNESYVLDIKTVQEMLSPSLPILGETKNVPIQNTQPYIQSDITNVSFTDLHFENDGHVTMPSDYSDYSKCTSEILAELEKIESNISSEVNTKMNEHIKEQKNISENVDTREVTLACVTLEEKNLEGNQAMESQDQIEISKDVKKTIIIQTDELNTNVTPKIASETETAKEHNEKFVEPELKEAQVQELSQVNPTEDYLKGEFYAKVEPSSLNVDHEINATAALDTTETENKCEEMISQDSTYTSVTSFKGVLETVPSEIANVMQYNVEPKDNIQINISSKIINSSQNELVSSVNTSVTQNSIDPKSLEFRPNDMPLHGIVGSSNITSVIECIAAEKQITEKPSDVPLPDDDDDVDKEVERAEVLTASATHSEINMAVTSSNSKNMKTASGNFNEIVVEYIGQDSILIPDTSIAQQQESANNDIKLSEEKSLVPSSNSKDIETVYGNCNDTVVDYKSHDSIFISESSEAQHLELKKPANSDTKSGEEISPEPVITGEVCKEDMLSVLSNMSLDSDPQLTPETLLTTNVTRTNLTISIEEKPNDVLPSDKIVENVIVTKEVSACCKTENDIITCNATVIDENSQAASNALDFAVMKISPEQGQSCNQDEPMDISMNETLNQTHGLPDLVHETIVMTEEHPINATKQDSSNVSYTECLEKLDAPRTETQRVDSEKNVYLDSVNTSPIKDKSVKSEENVVIDLPIDITEINKTAVNSEKKLSESDDQPPKVFTNSPNCELMEEKVITVDEEILVSANNSPYVSLISGIEANHAKTEETFEEIENPFVTKTNIASSPPIVSKGYNFNFDEIDDPFATKTRIRLSTSPETCTKPIEMEPLPVNNNKKAINRRKSQPAERKKPAPLKKKLNTSLDVKNALTTLDIKMDDVIEDIKNKAKNETNCETQEYVTKVPESTQSEVVEPLQNLNENEERKGTTMKENQPEQVVDIAPGNYFQVGKETNSMNDSVAAILNDNKTPSSSEQSTYYSAGASSTEEIHQSKNVFNLPEIDDMNFNPFATKSKIRQSPTPNTDVNSSDNTKNITCRLELNRTATFDETKVTQLIKGIDIEDKMETELMEKDTSANTTGTTSSKASHSQNVTREVNTEDEDTVEGPFLDDVDEIEKMPDFKLDNEDMMQFNEIKEATPGNEDNLDGEIFIDAEAFEFLLNQNKSNVVADSGKESLFLKFDPLFAKRISSDGVLATLNAQKKQSTPTKPTRPSLRNEASPIAGPSSLNVTYEGDNNMSQESIEDANITVTKPMMVVTPAFNPAATPRNKSITPTRSNRRSITFTSPAIAVIDRLLSMSSNNSLLGQDTTITHPNSEQTEADLALTQLRELLAEKEISVYNLRCESNELKDRLATMETQVRNLELESQTRLKKINELNERVAEKTRINKNMAAVVEEYERTIASLIADIEQDKKRNAEERIRLINERDEQTAHLTSMEVSFSDLHSKYEKSKQIILTCKANEDVYKKSIKDFEEQATKMQANYEMLKQHATAKLNHANQELEKMNRAHEAEVVKLKAMIKRNQLLATSLQETLAQKTKANDELTAICDELINKVG